MIKQRWFSSRHMFSVVLLIVGTVTAGSVAYAATAQSASSTIRDRDGHTYRTTTEDVIASDAIGVHLVKKGELILATPNTKTWPVVSRVASEDLMVGITGGALHLVKQGDRYMDDASIYVEPAAGLPTTALKPIVATEDTTVVGKSGLSVIRKGDTFTAGPYTKTRPAIYRVAPEDLSVHVLINQPQRVKKGDSSLDDITTYTERALSREELAKLPKPTTVVKP